MMMAYRDTNRNHYSSLQWFYLTQSGEVTRRRQTGFEPLVVLGVLLTLKRLLLLEHQS